MSQKNETTVLIASLLITLAVLGGGFLLFGRPLFTTLSGENRAGGSSRSDNRLSSGEKILVAADTTPQKQAGVKAFAQEDFSGAIAQFQASLETKANDPEALIYLNNAKAARGNPLKIAVSVPIGGNLNIAKEILRGVSQAQDEINTQGGIEGQLLEIVIANDDNNPTIAGELAEQFAGDETILAIVGHNSSNASLAAAPQYQQGKLVMISPTSDAKQLSQVGDYIFRTIPSIRFQADTLSRYAIDRANRKNIAVCIDSSAEYSQSMKEELTSAIFADGGRVVQTNCDFASPEFSASTALSQAISSGADAIAVVPAVNRLNLAIELAEANQRRLPLMGSSAMYTFEVLKQGQGAVKGMVLAVPWSPEASGDTPFAREASQLWGGAVNWRTALAYDAMQAIIAGFQQGNLSRERLQNALASPSFSAQGASGTIQFLPSGDRNGAALLVEIQPGNKSGTGFDFVPLP